MSEEVTFIPGVPEPPPGWPVGSLVHVRRGAWAGWGAYLLGQRPGHAYLVAGPLRLVRDGIPAVDPSVEGWVWYQRILDLEGGRCYDALPEALVAADADEAPPSSGSSASR